jgi:iron complex transport system substrate-binding protein
MDCFGRLLAIALIAVPLAACGGGEQAAPTGSAPAEGGAAFPVAIEHEYGTTTIERAPERVVVVGLREQDALLALGVVPVATTEWYGEKPGAIFEWAQDELGDAPVPTVLDDTNGVQLEKVAAQRPHLILAIYSGLEKAEYDKLSKLAPVVAQPKGQPDWGSSWQQETLITGAAVGRREQAQKLVEDTEKLIADTAAEHPEFEGRTAAVAADYQGVFVYGRQDVRTRMLEELGFRFPEQLSVATKGGFGGQLSAERTDLLDLGALVWFAEPAGERKIKRSPVYSELDVRKDGRDVFIAESDRAYDATSFVTVLSMPTLMREFVPRLARAADGDPKTSTDQQ